MPARQIRNPKLEIRNQFEIRNWKPAARLFRISNFEFRTCFGLAFVDAGRPWPIEFASRAWPRHAGDAPPAGNFVRQGPCCWQVWDLLQPCERLPSECQPRT